MDNQLPTSGAAGTGEALWEPVLAPVEYDDGWLSGIAQFRGAPHIFKSDSSDTWQRVKLYELWPISDDSTAALLQKWREVEAFAESSRKGSNDAEGWSSAWNGLMAAFENETAGRPPVAAMYGEFRSGSEQVSWHENAKD